MKTLKQQILGTHPTKGQIAVWYLGQESILLKTPEKTVLFDPYLSDSADRKNPPDPMWTRQYPAPLLPEEIDFVDCVFCSHGHTDHTDPQTLPAIAAHCPQAEFYVPVPVREKVLAMGIAPTRVTGVSADTVYTVGGGLSVTPVPAAHEALHRTGSGDYAELGYLLDTGTMKIYHAGDSCVYDGLAERVRGAMLAFLPINGRDYFRLSSDIIGNMDAREALLLADAAGFDTVVPMHHDLYLGNGVNPAYFADLVGRYFPRRKYKIFAPGERMLYADDNAL